MTYGPILHLPMRILPRSIARSCAAALALVLVACGTTAPVSPSPSGADAPPAAATAPAATAPASEAPASADPVAAAAYSAAICPLFERVVALDSRLAAIRAAGAGGVDATALSEELQLVSDELREVVNALDEVPTWTPGRRLQFDLMAALHAIRAGILAVLEDPGDPGAPDALAALPYVATQAMDREMARAIEGGLSCQPAG